MTTAHWHLILTHLPIVAVPFAALLLLAGVGRKSRDLRNAALVAFVICGLFTFFAKQTGDGAEGQIEELPGFVKSLVQQHEDIADKTFVLTSLLSIVSLGVLVAQSGRTLPGASYPAILVLAVGASASLIYTGALGGKIRHTEIRSENVSAQTSLKPERN